MAVFQTIIMFSFFLSAFLLATSVVGKNNQLHSLNESTQVQLCDNLIPGIQRMARGIDITKLDLFESESLDTGFGKVLVQYSCTLKQTWSPPNDLTIEYSKPDQLSGIDAWPTAKLNLTADFSQNTTEVKNSDLYKVGLGIDTEEYGSYSASASYQNTQDDILVKNRSVAEVSATVISSVIVFREPEGLLLKDDFINYINQKLSPVTYKDKPEVYEQFLRDYGTHYFDSALFGGYLQQKSTVENEYVSKTNAKTVKTNLKAAFTEKFKITNENDLNWNNVDEQFKSKSEITFFAYGGIADPMGPNAQPLANPVYNLKDDTTFDMSNWVKTVNQNPWLLGGNLKPLENLIQNEAVKAQVRIATQLYRVKAYLGEIKRAVQLTHHELTAEQKTALEKAEKLINSRETTNLGSVRTGMNQVLIAVSKI